MISREQLLAAANKLPVEKVNVRELGGELYIRGMSGRERDEWESSLLVKRGKRRDVNTDNVRAKLLVRCLVKDEAGLERLLSDGDVDILGELPATILNPLYAVAQRLSGVTEEDVDELEKSSAPTPEPGSTSPSI